MGITEVRKHIVFFLILLGIVFLQGCGGAPLKAWHKERLDEEFTQKKSDEVRTFDDYLRLEDRLFKQLDEKVYAQSETGPGHQLDRYSPGSAADPRMRQPDWNRSFELTVDKPHGAVLLLHGMSDSPYSMRALGLALNQRGYWVVGLRLPGHGTAPSGLRFINRQDMAAAVRIGMTHLGDKVEGKPVHIIGYSTGASLALEYTLDALEGKTIPEPGSLVLISPAIGIHAAAALAGFKNSLASMPGLSGKAFLQVQPEFDPFKYNSFATNASTVVHRVTRSVASRIETLTATNPPVVLPPILVLKSTVDATVTTDAVVDDLLEHLRPNRHELVLFDINRIAVVKSRLIISDPAPLTDRVMNDDKLPFSVTLVTNKSPDTTEVISKTKLPYSNEVSPARELRHTWPSGVISLSHVALPFSPDDPLYGQRSPDNQEFLFLGQMAIQGERGLLQIPTDWLLRLRYNPFFDFLQVRTLEWIDTANDQSR
jgi:esterase/lipase